MNIIFFLLFIFILYKINKITKIQQTKQTEQYKKININTDSIYNNINTTLYPKDTSYDKLIDSFQNKKSNYKNCKNEKNDKNQIWLSELKLNLSLISNKNAIFNRENLPVSITTRDTDTDNTLLPIAQAVVDIINEKVNLTSILTDIKNIEYLTTEDQQQNSFHLYINYPILNKINNPIFKNIQIKVVLIKRRIIQDEIFAPNMYDSTKFQIKSLEYINHNNINVKTNINNPNNYYSFQKLMTENGEMTNDEYINKEMIKTRKKHEHEMDFRNILIEDNNYLNDYMIPKNIC
jgi:hypothetical protein